VAQLERLVTLQGARVLEIRSKNAKLLRPLREQFGADVYGLPAFDRHHLKLASHGIPAGHLDFGEFRIPFEGQFDLVVANHMMTHALRPGELLAELARRVPIGGHVYFHTENDDEVLFARGKNLVGEMKCFHFQNFSWRVYQRALTRFGFALAGLFRAENNSASAVAILARRVEETSFDPAPPEEVSARIAMYRQWRDESLLTLPQHTRQLLGSMLPVVAERAVERGYARQSENGTVPVRKCHFTHVAGYSQVTGARQARRTESD
jgi:SAM-dependent methyltransferase